MHKHAVVICPLLTDFFIAYISLILFVVLYVGHKVVCRPSFVRPHQADIDTGREPLVNEMWETSDPVPWYTRGYRWLKHR